MCSYYYHKILQKRQFNVLNPTLFLHDRSNKVSKFHLRKFQIFKQKLVDGNDLMAESEFFAGYWYTLEQTFPVEDVEKLRERKEKWWRKTMMGSDWAIELSPPTSFYPKIRNL